MPAAWVTADEAYGGDPALRRWLEARGVSYALAVKRTELLATTGPDGPVRASAEQLAADVPAEQWVTASAGHGAKGRRLYDWTRVDLAAAAGGGAARWLLVRRWPGWYRHITLALLAHAFLVVTRAQATSDPQQGGTPQLDRRARSSPTDRSGGPASAGGAGLDSTDRAWLDAGLVQVAQAPSGPRPTRPLPATTVTAAAGLTSEQGTHARRELSARWDSLRR